jgi:hypothetical protein
MIGGVPIHHVEVKARSGKVVHQASNLRNSVLISLSPLIVGGILSFLLFDYTKNVWETDFVLGGVLAWLGFSIAFHSIPSHPDMVNIAESISRRFNELWSGSTGIGTKILKTGWYALVFPLAWAGASIVWLADLTLLTRIGWAVFVGWVA